MGRGAVLLLLSLAVGLGVGYVLGGAGDAPARAAPSRGGAASAAPGTSPPPAYVAGGSDPRLSAALRDLPVPHYPAGTGRITGSVRDAAGNGVAGATIRAMQHGRGDRHRSGDGLPPPETLEETVRRAVKSYHWRQQTNVDAVSDGAGAYALEGLGDQPYQLRAYLDGYLVRTAGGRDTWSVRAGETVDWVATPVVTVPVDVFLPDGTRPTRAWIQCKVGNRTSSEVWDPERREIRLEPGAYTLSVSLMLDESMRADPVTLSVETGRPVDPITFQLVGRPGIRGAVRFAGGESFANLNVFALRFTGDEAPTTAQLGSQGNQNWIHPAGGMQFEFLDLPPGRYLIGVGADADLIFRTQTVDVGDGVASADIVVDAIDPSMFIVLRVLGPDGEPAVLEEVATSYRSARGSSSGGGTWARWPDGRYIVFHHDHDQPDGGTYGVEVTSPQYGKKSISYQLGKEREFELRFAAPATLAVTVSGFAGADHADRVQLGLRRPEAELGPGDSPDKKAPDGDGRAVLGPVEAGEYEAVLFVRVGRHAHLPAVRKTITLPPGASELALPMPRLHELIVRGEKGAQFNLGVDPDAGVWFHEQQTCGDDGRAVFGPLPAGRYVLRQNAKAGEMELTVPCPEVTFEASEYTALRVSIANPEGMLGKAGFLDDDLVIGVNGTEFTGTAQMQMLFAGSMAKEETKMTVLRGGRTLELSLNMQKLVRGGDPGGSFRPTTR